MGTQSTASRATTLLWAGLALMLSGGLGAWLWAHPQLLSSPHWSWKGHEMTLNEGKVLWLLPLIPLLIFGVGRSFADLPWQQRVVSLLLRAGFFCALALSMSHPVESESSTRICSVVLVDVSDSVSDEALAEFRKEFLALANKKTDDELRLIGFGRRAREIPLASDEGGSFLPPSIAQLRATAPGDATDIESALLLAAAFSRRDCISRTLIFTDGIETRGHALSLIAEARARGTRVSTHLLDKSPPRDVALHSVEIPSGVRVGEPFVVRVQLSSTGESKGQLRLYQGKSLNGLSGVLPVELTFGKHLFEFKSVVRHPGDVMFRAEFVPDGDDAFLENNEYLTAVEVPGPPKILVVDRNPGQISYLTQALVAQQLDVDVRAPTAMPQSSEEFSGFQFVILSDLARKNVSRRVEELLTRYITAGGGLLFSGGEAGFGPGGWQGSKLEKILPVRMDAKKEREIPGVAMALVIDRSGSMTGLPLAMAKEAVVATLGILEGNDLIEVIAFDSRPKRFVKMQPARYKARIASSVSRIQPGGGTEIFNSLDMAYQDLAAVEARKKHIILLTDGNAGSDGLYELAGAAFSEGITITSVGLGGGANRALLSMVSEAGGGRFHRAEDPSRLPRIFTRETELISKRATLEDWFPVGVVRSAAFLNGIDMAGAPLLRGYTSTQLGPVPSEMILASDRGEPILARRRVGLGWSIAWTSDLKARWAVDWLKWRQFGKIVSQLIRDHQLRDDTEVRPMSVEIVDDELVARFEAYQKDESFDNSLRSSLRVRRIGQKSAPVLGNLPETTSFQHVAPGLYQARVHLPEYGSYALKATHQTLNARGKWVSGGVSYGSVTRPYPDEFRDLKPRPLALTRWAEFGGGFDVGSPASLWEARGDTVTSHQSRQNDFIFLAIGFFLLDLLFRRVRLFDRDFKRGIPLA